MCCYDNEIEASDWSKFKYSLISTKIGTLGFSSVANSMIEVLKLSVAMVTKWRPLIGRNLNIL